MPRNTASWLTDDLEPALEVDAPTSGRSEAETMREAIGARGIR
jgi:hypothetical protein